MTRPLSISINLLFGLLLCISIPIFSATEAFLLERGLLYNDAFDMFVPNNEAAFVFQNPARIAPAEMAATIASSSNDFFGYNQLSISQVVPLQYWVLAVGLARMGADDLVEAGLTSDRRPAATGSSFSDVYTRLAVSLGHQYTSALQLGVRGGYFGHELYNDSAEYYSFDVGLTAQLHSALMLSVYTQNLLTTSLVWAHSTEALTIDSGIVVEFDFRADSFQQLPVRLSTNLKQHRVLGQFYLMPQAAINADFVFDEGMSILRQSLGTSLHLGTFSLSYFRHEFRSGLLNQTRDEIALQFTYSLDRFQAWLVRPVN